MFTKKIIHINPKNKHMSFSSFCVASLAVQIPVTFWGHKVVYLAGIPSKCTKSTKSIHLAHGLYSSLHIPCMASTSKRKHISITKSSKCSERVWGLFYPTLSNKIEPYWKLWRWYAVLNKPLQQNYAATSARKLGDPHGRILIPIITRSSLTLLARVGPRILYCS